jgi:hypothetical protein
MARLKKRIEKQIKNMPKYQTQQEYDDNVALAASRAFGRPQEIAIAEENLDQSQSDALGNAKDITSSTSSLLSTLAAIEGGKQTAVRNLAQDEASIKSQNVRDLYGAKTALAEEKDKAWYQNVYAPWEAKLRNMQQQKANRAAFWSNLAGGLVSGAGSFFSGGFGVGGGGAGAGAAGAGGGITNIDASNTLPGTVA